MKRHILCALALVGSAQAFANTSVPNTKANMQVTANTEASCYVQATDLNFGVIDINIVLNSTLNHPIMLNAEMTIRCTKGANVQIEANSLNNINYGYKPMGFYSGTLEMDGNTNMTIGYQLHLPALKSTEFFEIGSRNTTGFGTNTSITSTDYSLRVKAKTNEEFKIPYTAGIQKSTVDHTKEVGSYSDSVVYTMQY